MIFVLDNNIHPFYQFRIFVQFYGSNLGIEVDPRTNIMHFRMIDFFQSFDPVLIILQPINLMIELFFPAQILPHKLIPI